MSRRRRQAEIWGEILAIWADGQISREAGQVCHIKAMLVVLLSILVWSVSQPTGTNLDNHDHITGVEEHLCGYADADPVVLLVCWHAPYAYRPSCDLVSS